MQANIYHFCSICMTVPFPTKPFDIPKALDWVWHAGLLHKLKSYGSSNHIFSLVLSFLSNRHFLVVLDDKSSKEYSVNVGVPPGFIPSSTFSFKLYWECYIISIAKTSSKKIGELIRSTNFLSPELVVHLCKSTIQPCMVYCFHAWTDAHSCYLEFLDRLQKWKCRTVGTSLDTSLEPFTHCRNVASLSLFYKYYFGTCSAELAPLVSLLYSCERSTHYYLSLHSYTLEFSAYRMFFFDPWSKWLSSPELTDIFYL